MIKFLYYVRDWTRKLATLGCQSISIDAFCKATHGNVFLERHNKIEHTTPFYFWKMLPISSRTHNLFEGNECSSWRNNGYPEGNSLTR